MTVRFVNGVAQRAVKNKYGSSEKKEHWLYYADDKYDVSKAMHRVVRKTQLHRV